MKECIRNALEWLGQKPQKEGLAVLATISTAIATIVMMVVAVFMCLTVKQNETSLSQGSEALKLTRKSLSQNTEAFRLATESYIQQRDHYRLTIKPRLVFSEQFSDRLGQVGLFLKNEGMGPAVIKYTGHGTRLLQGGSPGGAVPINSLRDIVTRVGLDKVPITMGAPSRYLSPGKRLPIIALATDHSKKQFNVFVEAMSNLLYYVEYCSTYDEDDHTKLIKIQWDGASGGHAVLNSTGNTEP